MKNLALVAAVVVATACSAAPPPAPKVIAANPPGAAGAVLVGYEKLRTALAADQVDAIFALGQSIEAAARTMVEEKKPGGPEVLAGATAITALGDKPDIEKARLAYGELSKGVVVVVAADASLQVGRFLFECPMARGYQRWVQLEPIMANPYMGKRMLVCGTAVKDWKV
ncbi:MAG: hypothetical protein Q8O67_16220 [Deltaproteobacteria bacterium]|nr:hypothetical protein [Deltaproteobacteria bacterium]